MPRVVIIGAGPAGMAAATLLAQHGVRPVVVDEAPRPGGQIWRKPTTPVATDTAAILGHATASEYARGHVAFASVSDRLTHLPQSLAWNLHGGEVFAVRGRETTTLPYDVLLLATGATDRLLPVPGWTLPGVFSLGGAQTLLKDQGTAIGRRVVFVGASPLLYLAASQYHAMGVTVAAILDTTRFAAKLRAVPGLAGAVPRILARGLSLMAGLRARGVPIHHGAADLSIAGEGWVQSIRFRDSSGQRRDIPCDAVALGFGLRAETQLADLAGVPLRFDPTFRQWLPETDADGRCGPGLYAAGDGCMIAGAEAAAISGRLAAWAILADSGAPTLEREVAALRRRLARLRRFQRGLAHAFAWPAHWLAGMADDTTLCRCENVTIGTLRKTAGQPLGPQEVNRAKALTRCGMGRCQGRFCGLAAAEVIAQTLGRPVEQVGRLRNQAPVKPIPLDVASVEHEAA